MAKILLLDFDESDHKRLISEKYDAGLLTTGWTSGDEKTLDIPADCDVVFYRLDSLSPEEGKDLHSGAHEDLVQRVEGGARVVCFIGDCRPFQLTNIVGPLSGIELLDSARPDSILFNPRALFHVPLERYRPFISKAWKLASDAFEEGEWEKETATNGRIEVLAKSAEGQPVAALLRKGAGYYLFLPSFGEKNVEVVEYLLKDKLTFSESGPEAEEDMSWIEKEDYVFPELKGLFAKKKEETQRHEKAMAKIDAEIQGMKSGGQEMFHKLLKAEGAELKASIVHAFMYLEFGEVIDVDSYWKNVIRDKEEDIWLINVEGQSLESSLRVEPLTLIHVRSNKNWATDDECSVLQIFKGRRMQEFDNTKMKAILVGNYFCTTDPVKRDNPFSAVQIDEAQKDGNGLLTTYELFKALKAEKEGKMAKEAIRKQLWDKTGIITFEA